MKNLLSVVFFIAAAVVGWKWVEFKLDANAVNNDLQSLPAEMLVDGKTLSEDYLADRVAKSVADHHLALTGLDIVQTTAKIEPGRKCSYNGDLAPQAYAVEGKLSRKVIGMNLSSDLKVTVQEPCLSGGASR